MKLLSLISGGIDSPVATYLMLSQGADVACVHFDNRPFTDDGQFNKTKALVAHLEKTGGRQIKTFVVPHKENHLAFGKNCKRSLHCVLCRRMMFRIAEVLARTQKAQALLTGESLGQVASQTLQNIRSESTASKIPILRPLIGFDKLEIEAIAKKIGTYEISILPGMCCTIVPKRPSTYSKPDAVLAEEEKIDVKALVEDSLSGVWEL